MELVLSFLAHVCIVWRFACLCMRSNCHTTCQLTKIWIHARHLRYLIYLCKFRLAYESDTSRRDDMWHLSHLFDFRSASLPDCAQNFPLFLCKCLLFVMATNILLHVWPEVEWLRKNYELRQYKSQVNNDTIRLISTSSSVYCCLQLLLSLSLDFFFIFIT